MDFFSQEVEENNIRTTVDDREEKLGYRMRDTVTKKIQYTLVLGDNEKAEEKVTYRKYGQEEKVTASLEDFIKYMLDIINNKK